MSKAGRVAGTSPLQDGTGSPVNMWIVAEEPGEISDQRQTRLVQNVKS